MRTADLEASRHLVETLGGMAAGLGLVLGALPGAAQAKDEPPPAAHEVSGVDVVGERQSYAAERSSMAKLGGDLVETPQSIDVVTRAELDDRAVTSIDDALRTVPGISLGAGEYSFQGSNVVVRGFTSRNDMFLDGMRDFGYYFRDTFNAENVEVLKGSASILFGRGSTGGVINQTSKRPYLTTGASALVAVGSDDTRRATLDLNLPLAGLGTGAALRLNAMGHQSAVAGQDGGESRRWGFAPTLALGLGTDTWLLASYFHQSEDNRPDYGVPWFNGRPAAVDPANFYGFAQDYFDADVDIATVSAEHDFDATSGVRAQVRYSSAARDFRITEAQIPAGTPAATPLAAITVNRLDFQGSSADRFAQAQVDWHGELHAGPTVHRLVAGVEVGREWATPDYISQTGVPGTNLARPDTAQPYSYATRFLRLTARTRADTTAAYLMDTVAIGPKLEIVGGVRFDRFEARYHSTGFAASGAVTVVTDVDRTDQAPSWRVAAIWRPNEAASLYAAYGTSFNPSAEGIESLISSGRALTQSNLNLDPEESANLEVGGKTRLFGGRALASLAIFQLEKSNVRVPDPTTPGFNILGGEQRVRGAEAEIAGQLTAALQLRANYTYLDSKTTKSAPGGPLVGAPLPVTPRHSAAVWGVYDATAKLRLGGGLRYVGERLGQNTAASYLRAPGYTVFDAMAEYRLSETVGVKVNVFNIGDETYYDQLHPFHVTPGAGRSVLLTLTYSGW